jgi:hypothetical protein
MRCARKRHGEHTKNQTAKRPASSIGTPAFLRPAIDIPSIGMPAFFPPEAEYVA